MAFYAPGTIIPSKLHLYHPEHFKQDYFPILDLPGEIRNKIYDTLFEACLVDVGFRSHYPFSESGVDLQDAVLQQQSAQESKELGKPSMQQRPYDGNQVPWMMFPNDFSQSSAVVHDLHGKRQPRGSKSRRGRLGRKNDQRLCHRVVRSFLSVQEKPAREYSIAWNLLLSNRQIYNEGLSVLYAKTTFRFTCSKATTRFLSSTPAQALKAIQTLHMGHSTYPEPELSKNRGIKKDYDAKWSRTCRLIQKKVTGLRRLRVYLQINDWPSQLRFDEGWARPILLLRGSGLDRVDAFLYHAAFSEQTLKDASRNLENAMMSSEGQLAKRVEENKILQANAKKAAWKPPRVLVIKMDNKPTMAKPQKA